MDTTTPTFLLYGAYGYTGKLIAELAKKQGLRPLLAGRNENKLQTLADSLDLPYQALDLHDTAALDAVLSTVPVVLHAAGPYAHTAQPMVEACLRTATHYVDITGEIEVFEWVADQHHRAQQQDIVLLPGAGFDVVPTDCLAAHVASRVDNPTHLELAFKGAQQVSRGTARTAVENMANGSFERREGKLTPVPAGHVSRMVDFGKGPRLTAAIPWGDIATAYRSTGIPNIITYTATTPGMYRMMRVSRYIGWLLGAKPVQRMLLKQVDRRVTGPSAEDREQKRSYVWAKARNARGEVAEARLVCMEAYRLTAFTALEATLRLAREHDISAGYHTPATAFGADYILAFEHSLREDL